MLTPRQPDGPVSIRAAEQFGLGAKPINGELARRAEHVDVARVAAAGKIGPVEDQNRPVSRSLTRAN